jgi:hypothetical protein
MTRSMFYEHLAISNRSTDQDWARDGWSKSTLFFVAWWSILTICVNIQTLVQSNSEVACLGSSKQLRPCGWKRWADMTSTTSSRT